ncbi:MAG: metalloregulator ArsR/SmtB family transcription factor [Acidimicrobiales bacterium]
MSSNDALSRTFSALADPTRRAILERLSVGEAGVVELADNSRLTQPAITKHLQVLERAGLIIRSREGQRRPARLHLEGLSAVDDWLRRAQADWSERLDRLETYLTATTKATTHEENPDA